MSITTTKTKTINIKNTNVSVGKKIYDKYICYFIYLVVRWPLDKSPFCVYWWLSCGWGILFRLLLVVVVKRARVIAHLVRTLDFQKIVFLIMFQVNVCTLCLFHKNFSKSSYFLLSGIYLKQKLTISTSIL